MRPSQSLRPGGVAAGDVGDAGEGVALEGATHLGAGLVPDREQHALALVVAGTVLVRLAEVAERDRAIDGRNDLGEQDLLGWPRQHVPAADAPFRTNESRALQGEQDLLEVGLGEAGAVGDVAHGGRPGLGVQREREQRSGGIVTAGRDAHGVTLLSPLATDAPSGPLVDTGRFVVDWHAVTITNGGGPIIPDYSGPNVRGIIPALLGPSPWSNGLPDWFPSPIADAEQAVLLVLDGLGWDQFEAHRDLMPTLSSMTGRPIHTVAPTTTATALSSIATGLTPAEHGLIGYRMVLGGEIMNVLRWTVGDQAVRRSHPPRDVQPFDPFLGQSVPVVSPAELQSSAFSEAHLRGALPRGWRAASSIAVEAADLVAAGERFVYCYYGGDRQDRPRARVRCRTTRPNSARPTAWSATSSRRCGPGTAVIVTADHGQVHVADHIIHPSAEMLAGVSMQSGEGRFRWLHAQNGAIAIGRRGCHRRGRSRGVGRDA